MSVSGGAFSGDNLSVTLSGVAKIDGLSGTWNRANITMSGTARMNNLTLKSGACYLTCSGVAEIAGVSSISSDKVQLSMSGATSIKIDNINSGIVDATASGAGKLSSLEVNASELIANLSGASAVKFTGKSENLSRDAGSFLSVSPWKWKRSDCLRIRNFYLECQEFTVKDASLKLSGVAGATVTVTENSKRKRQEVHI